MKPLAKNCLFSGFAILGIMAYALPLAAAVLIYDKNDPDLVKATAGIAGTTGVQNVEQAAAAVPDRSSAVIFAGHGESGVLGLGSGTSGGYHPGQDLMYGKLSDVENQLRTINQKLSDNSIVVLSGCYTGKDPHGTQLLKEMSVIITKATIFSNKNCVGLTRDLKKGSVCTAEGKTYWQQSSTLAARNGSVAQADRDQIKKMNAASCAP